MKFRSDKKKIDRQMQEGQRMKNIELETVLKNEYGKEINISKVSPLHDEDFDAAYMICLNDVMICRADMPLKTICETIENYKK